MNQTPLSVTELFRQYLRRQMEAQAAGLSVADPDEQVMPHESAPMQPVDPRLAWQDALAAIDWDTKRKQDRQEAPPDWPSLVAAQEPAIALAFCAGNFPQMVRNLQLVLAGPSRFRTEPESRRSRPFAVFPALIQWANAIRDYPQRLLGAGVLRLARRFEEASELLRSSGETPPAWQALRANEEAALAWHRGNTEEALTSWQAQKPCVPVLFNRGMASLFLGRPAEARSDLEQAISRLPEASAWHHLGHLYLTLSAVC